MRVLNKLKPHYVASMKDEVLLRSDKTISQLKVDIFTRLNSAINRWKKTHRTARDLAAIKEPDISSRALCAIIRKYKPDFLIISKCSWGSRLRQRLGDSQVFFALRSKCNYGSRLRLAIAKFSSRLL